MGFKYIERPIKFGTERTFGHIPKAMDKKDELSICVLNIIKTSQKVVKRTLVVMKEIADGGTDTLNEIEYCTKAEKTVCKEFIEKETLDIVETAESIITGLTSQDILSIKETGKAEEYILRNEFLNQVYHGDVYDGFEGIEALKELQKDLNETLKRASNKEIIKNVCLAIRNM